MKLLIILALLLFGCTATYDTRPTSTRNDDRIREYKKCKDAGMDAERTGNDDVMCVPPKGMRE